MIVAVCKRKKHEDHEAPKAKKVEHNNFLTNHVQLETFNHLVVEVFTLTLAYVYIYIYMLIVK